MCLSKRMMKEMNEESAEQREESAEQQEEVLKMT